MKTIITLLVSLNIISYSFGQETISIDRDTCSYILIPSIIIDCVFNREIGWQQVAHLEVEQLYSECSIDSVELFAYDTINTSLDTVFNLSSTRIQINQDQKDCWFVQLLPAKMFIYSNYKVTMYDSLTVRISISENSKKCACNLGKEITSNIVNFDFGKMPLEFNQKRNKATKLGLNKKKYSSDVIEYNHDAKKIIRVDELQKVQGKIYIDESHISTGFSRNNNFPEAKYEIVVNSKEKNLVVLMSKCRREDGDLLIWKVIIKSGKIEVTAWWYSGGELKTTYFVYPN